MLPFCTVEISPPPLLDLVSLPRTYRASFGYRLFFGLLGGIAVAGGSAAAWYFATGHEVQSRREAFIMAAIFSLFVILGLYLIATGLGYSVSLLAYDFDVMTIFGSRSLLRADIAGRRILRAQYVSTLVLMPRPGAGKKLKIALTFKQDPAFYAWLDGIANLDAQEREASKRSLAVDPDLGFESTDRIDQVGRARRLAKPLNAVGFVALVWGVFYPRPYFCLICILAALPVVALALLVRSRGIFQIDDYRNDVHPTLGLFFIGPSLALALRAALDMELLQWKAIMAIACLVAAAIVLVIAGADRGARRRWWSIAISFLLSAAYGYGLAVQTNALLDKSPAQVFHAVVADKRISTGELTTYYLHLEPWGPQTDVTEVSVEASFYAATPRGATVCVYLHPGALTVPWYRVGRCS